MSAENTTTMETQEAAPEAAPVHEEARPSLNAVDMSPDELMAAYNAVMQDTELSSEEGTETADAVAAEEGEEASLPVEPGPTEITMQDLMAEVQAMRKKTDGLEYAYQQSQTELGQLRKMRREFLERQLKDANAKPSDYADNFDYYGEKAPVRNEYGDHDKEERKRQLQEIDALEAADRARQHREQVSRLVPDFAEQLDSIVELIKGMAGNNPGADSALTRFRENPYMEAPQTLVFAAMAAKERKKVREAEARLAEIEKRMTDLTATRTRQLQRARTEDRLQPKVGTRSGQASTNGQALSKPVHEMSLAELEKEYRKLIS